MARARATDETALIRAAGQVFRDKGYHNATIDDIAEAAHISRPTVYAYAESKRWILDRLVDQLLDEVDARLEADSQAGATPLEHLRAVIGTYVSLAVDNRALYPVLLTEETDLSPKMRKRYRLWAHRNTNFFRNVLEDCLSDGTHEARLDSTIAANLIVSMLTSIYRWYDPKGPLTPEQLTDQIFLLISGVLKQPPSAVSNSQDLWIGAPRDVLMTS